MPFLERKVYDAARSKAGRAGRNRGAYDAARLDKQGANRRLPFVGVDGEGAGGSWVEDYKQRDMFGLLSDNDPFRKWQQHYKLLRIGDEYILSQERPLTTMQCLEFVANQSNDRLMVGYFFDYDVTMILRDVNQDDVKEILTTGFAGYVSWRGYAITYIPKQKLGVGRTGANGFLIKNSMRYIYDVGRFFQCPFTKALKQWDIVDDKTLAKIQQGKDARGKDRGVENAVITEDDIEYNRLECEALAWLVDDLRDTCIEGDCVPRSWTGPGQIASRMLEKNKVLKRKEYSMAPEHHAAWEASYFGGRFETSLFGRYEHEVYEYDIHSAYPHAMQSLPCLKHSTIGNGTEIENNSVALIAFSHSKAFQFCAFPIRQKDGSLCFPRQGRGWYAGREILAAQAAGVEITILGPIYTVKSYCDCKPFAWVKDIYELRRRIGAGTKGVALKLGINSLYGKTVQRIGSAPYYNPIWASLITSETRARLFTVAHQNDSVIMLATDALYSTRPLKVTESDELGDWECHTYDTIFIAKPGIYVAGSKYKTRGVPLTLFQQEFPKIEKIWNKTCEKRGFLKKNFKEFPSYNFTFRLFCGVRLALQRDFNIRGTWSDQIYKLTMDWTNKRETGRLVDYYMTTHPKQGSGDLTSVLYDETTADKEFKDRKLMIEAMPDFFAFDPIDVNGG